MPIYNPPAGGAGTGDVVGPSFAVDGNLALFDTATGKLIKDGGSPAAITPRVVLPAETAAVVGDELQLFTRGTIEAVDPYALPVSMVSTVGYAYPRYFSYTPVIGDVGDKTLTVTVRDATGAAQATDSVTLKVVNATAQPAAATNVLCVGDSLTQSGEWVTEMYRRLCGTGGTPAGKAFGNIAFIGDGKLTGYTGGYNGYAGWAMAMYIGTYCATSGHVLTPTTSFDKDSSDVGSYWIDGSSNTWQIIYTGGALKVGTLFDSGVSLAASGTLTHVSGATHTADIVYSAKTDEPLTPFWNSGGTFGFTDFIARQSAATPDVVYLMCSWNSIISPYKTDFSAYIGNIQTFVNKLHTDCPSCKVRIMGAQVPSPHGGLGASYRTASTSDYYGMLKTVMNNNIALETWATGGSYSSYVRYIDIAAQVDSEYNMPYTNAAVNVRNTAVEMLGTNGIHPSTAGQMQIADAAYRDFIRTYCA